jgi:hypothetical protein
MMGFLKRVMLVLIIVLAVCINGEVSADARFYEVEIVSQESEEPLTLMCSLAYQYCNGRLMHGATGENVDVRIYRDGDRLEFYFSDTGQPLYLSRKGQDYAPFDLSVGGSRIVDLYYPHPAQAADVHDQMLRSPVIRISAEKKTLCLYYSKSDNTLIKRRF